MLRKTQTKPLTLPYALNSKFQVFFSAWLDSSCTGGSPITTFMLPGSSLLQVSVSLPLLASACQAPDFVLTSLTTRIETAAFGMSWTFILTTVFLTQHSRIQPATLLVLANMLRNSGAAVSAAIIEPLVRKMGLGWCFSGLAFVQVFGVAAVVYLVYGRRKSPKDVEKAGMERSPGGSMPRVLPNVSTGK
jgi:hypothetical protein